VFGKGQKGRTLPLRGRVVLELEAWSMTPLELVERTPEPDDFLLYPEKRTAGGRLLAAYPKRRLQPTSMHRWWYQRLGDADLVGAGVTSGLNMHRARHTFATEVDRLLTHQPELLNHFDQMGRVKLEGIVETIILAELPSNPEG